MIKYLELTAPEESQFRQAKILKVMVQEGEEVNAGDALFRVASGSTEVDLPSRLTGRVVEIIVDAGENISLMTPLVLLETEVEKSTASKPISEQEPPTAEKAPINKEPTANKDPSAGKEPSVSKESSAPKELDTETDTKPKKKSKAKKPKTKKTKQQKNTAKAKQAETHQQQSLNLDGQETEQQSDEIIESPTQSPSTSSEDTTEPELTESHNMSEIKIAVPDIGIDSAKVIEILVSVGDTVSIDDPLLTLESDKASMDVPSTAAGTISSIDAAVDQDVAEGDIIVTLTASEADTSAAEAAETEQQTADDASPESRATEEVDAPAEPAKGGLVDVVIPDIGGDSANVIEILVEAGQTIEIDDPLVTLESDKASMDVPSTVAGTIQSIAIKLDEEASEGMLVARVQSSESSPANETNAQPEPEASADQSNSDPTPKSAAARPAAPVNTATLPPTAATNAPAGKSHASPSVRRFARELGADLSEITGSGRKNRVTKDDVKAFVKNIISGSGGSTAGTPGAGIPEVPAIDFSKFGDIDIQPLNKIKKLTAANLHRSWLNVPHVTHNDESNISDLEDFRKQLNAEYKAQNREIKLSPLAFIVKAVVNALQTYPQFNASLEPGGESLIYKKYFHIGIAVDTPNGLVVPVVRDADQKSVAEIAQEMGELAGKARDKKLRPGDMSGACFTISSLGGIGGTSFTPIINTPEVAILGVSRSKIEPVWNGEEFKPGMILPLSLSYDHRVIDGAEAARFTRQIAAVLEDVRRLAV